MSYQENVQMATCDMKQRANEREPIDGYTRCQTKQIHFVTHFSLFAFFPLSFHFISFVTKCILFMRGKHLTNAEEDERQAKKKRNNNVTSKDTKLIYYFDLMFYASFLPCVCASCDEHRLRFYLFAAALSPHIPGIGSSAFRFSLVGRVYNFRMQSFSLHKWKYSLSVLAVLGWMTVLCEGFFS